MVHCNTYAVPAVPLNVAAGFVALEKLPPAPLTIVQRPVPTVGALAGKVADVDPQVAAPVWSAPALAVVGFCWKVTFTWSLEAAQGALVIVHCNT